MQPRSLDAHYFANKNVVIDRENFAPRIFQEVLCMRVYYQSQILCCSLAHVKKGSSEVRELANSSRFKSLHVGTLNPKYEKA